MTALRKFASLISLSLFMCLSAGVALADPPSRAVDIRYISGEVSVQPGGVNDWVAAVVNRPLTTSDRVWTDKEARAELHLGTAALRMNAETSLTLTNVSDQTVQVELDQGTSNLWIRHLYDGEIYEIDTPNLAFTVTKSGDYRFDVDPNGGTTLVTVWKGEGEATGQGNAVKVHAHEQARFLNGTSMEHQISDAPGFDGFDDWCRVRDERLEHSESVRYVSPDIVGVDDLDEYGHWRVVAGYGPIWAPAHVEVGWAPYHFGHWVWVEPWGWTWVDDAPWGYAPCHYGRWVFVGGYWGWAPGPVVVGVRPVYAPALVAWAGGAHWGVGVSFGASFGVGGGVGWFPLGWNEPYVPAYAVSRNYFNNVNVTNIHVTNTTVINNYYNNTTAINNIHYTNRTVQGAFTAVPANTLANGQPVAQAAVRVPASEIERAPLASAAPVAPSQNAVLGVKANARTAVPPAAAVSRNVVTKTASPPKPVPFEARQQALARNPGKPLDEQTMQQLRTRTPQAAVRPGNPGNVGSASTNAQPGRVVPRPPQPGMNASQSKPANVSQPKPEMHANRTVPHPPQGSTPAAPRANAGSNPTPKPSYRSGGNNPNPPNAGAGAKGSPGGNPHPETASRNIPHPSEQKPHPNNAPHANNIPHPNSVPRPNNAAQAHDHAAPHPRESHSNPAPHENREGSKPEPK